MSADANRFDSRVAAAHATSYDDAEVARALERACYALGWGGDGGRGPLGGVVREGARVLVKPNFVLHENQGPWGVEPLLTHGSVVRAAVEANLPGLALEIVTVDSIPRTRANKWRPVVSEVEPAKGAARA